MSDQVSIEKFDVVLNWTNPEEFLNLYNNHELAEYFTLTWVDGRLKAEVNGETSSHQVETLARVLVKHSTEGEIHAYVSAFGHYFGYQWAEGRLYELDAHVEYLPGQELELGD